MESLDHLPRPVDAAGDLRHGAVLHGAVNSGEGLLQLANDDVRVRVARGEDERLSGQRRVDVPGELLRDHTVELLRDDAAVEGVHLERHVVGSDRQVDVLGERVEERQVLALLEHDAGLGKRRLDPDRGLLVDQPAVHHGLAEAIGEDRPAEDLRRVQGRRRGEADLDGVKVLQDAPVLRDVVLLTAEAELRVAQLAVEGVAAVALVHDEQVVLVHRGHVLRHLREEHALDQRLHGADVDLGRLVGRGLIEALEAEDLCEGVRAHDARRSKLAAGLLAERGAVHDEAHPPEAPRRQQPVERGDGKLGLARAGRHGQQQGPQARVGESSLHGLDGAALVGAQHEAEVEGLRGELGLRLARVLAEQRQQAVGRVPVRQRPAVVGRRPRVAEPDARLGLDLLEVAAAVGREQERHPEAGCAPATSAGQGPPSGMSSPASATKSCE